MYDVTIVGGGPAGAIAAHRAAKAGLSVLVLEKAKYPRDKPCGGGVSQKALSVIGKIDKELVERELFGARIFLSDHRNFTEILDDRIAITTMRRNLDHWLIKRAEAAGAVVRDCEGVTDLHVSKDYAEVVTSGNRYRSRIVIGSDGVNSTVARKSGIRKRWDDGIGICLEAEVELGETLVEECVGTEIAEFYFVGDWGYGWVFPKSDRISIGVGGWKTEIHEPKRFFERFAGDVSRQKGIDIKSRIRRVNSYRIPAGGFDRRIVGDRVLLAGDAAGFVDPFLGEGMYYAMKSGEIAADTVVDAARDDRFSEEYLQRYVMRCEEEFNYDLRSALKFANVVYGHQNLFLKILERDRRLFREYLRVVRGDRTYTDFNRWCIMRSPVTLARLVI
ncbi:MAG: NAD(P)/FAD-dependent oxidoreductase [Methanosarcinales archaeon]|nr:NAD(P)/FAD-dependent oxidoreductase [Methanosarcinales archaeon]